MHSLARNTKLWIIAGVVLLAATGLAHWHWANQEQPLIIFSEVSQVAVGAIMLAGVLVNLFRTRQENARLFWLCMSVGCAIWWAGLIVWAWHEILHHSIAPPDLGNILVYLHVVAMMAAFAMQPHREWHRPDNQPRLLDFALLVLWWVYLYLFVVVPWRYVSPDLAHYRLGFNAVYTFELVVLQIGIGALCLRSRGGWSRTYLHYLLAGSIYAVVINAIHVKRMANGTVLHHHGPLVAVLFYFAWIGWNALPLASETTAPEQQPYGLWRARAAMAAILSIPFIAIWSYILSTA